MSQKALLIAFRDQLKAKLGLGSDECEVMEDGQPPAGCGEKFFAIHPGAFTNHHQLALETLHALSVTITMRAPKSPHDRRGPSLLIRENGLYDQAEKVIAAMHMDPTGQYDTVNMANRIINAHQAATGFVEPLIFTNCSAPMKKPGAWFEADNKEPNAGLALQLEFGEAKRTQKIEDQT